jgi:dolichol-phosphate mannosyltransferase
VAGFEVAIELCCKAYQQKEKITELPTEWFDRTVGESRFRLFYWLPHYLKWYLLSLKCIIQRKFFK